MDQLLDLLVIIWGRLNYLAGVPVQAFGEWAYRNTAYYLLSPEIILLIAILIICLLEIFSKRDNFNAASWIGIVGLLLSFVLTVHMMYYTSRYYTYGLGLWWGGLETLDPYALFFKQLMDWGDILLFLALFSYKPLKHYRVEFVILVLTGTIAFDLMVGSSDLLAVYVMAEFGGICGYILAAYYKRSLLSLEAGLKYFVIGATSSSALLFGMSILYGTLNTTNIYQIKQALMSGGGVLPPVIFSVVLILVALGYKVGIAPFHLWVADTYEGAPTPVAAFLAVFPKVAGYAVLLRLLFIPFSELQAIWIPILIVMTVASLVFGNVAAMRQTSFKRMMGFSGVGHLGYILIAIIAASYTSTAQTESLGFYSAMYYMLVYFFMNIGVFVVAMIIESQGGTDHLDSYNGLVRRNPLLTVLMTILLAGLIGLPPTTGFIAKFLVFYSLTTFYNYNPPWNIILLVFAVITTVISAYYYMSLAYRMWVLPPALVHSRRFDPPLFQRLAVLVPALLVLVLGIIYVSVPFNYAKDAYFLTWYEQGMSGL